MGILGEIANGDSSGLVGGMLGAAGGIGFAMWYGYYVTTKTLPSIVSDFRQERILDREESKATRKEFTDAIDKLSTAVGSLPCRDGSGHSLAVRHPQEHSK